MELSDALARTAELQHGVLTTAQLAAAGLRRHQVQYQVDHGIFARPHPGLLVVVGSPPTWLQRVAVGALATSPCGGASHRTAARVFGFRTVDEGVDVTVRYPRRLVVPGVRVVRSRDLAPGDLTWVVVGGHLYRVDFAYVAPRVFIEIDGRDSHSGGNQIAADGGRQNDLVSAGWLPVRFTSERLRREPAACATEVRHALRLRICEPESPDSAASGSQIPHVTASR